MENLCEYKILDDDLASPKYFGKNRGTIYTNLCAFWWFLFLFYNYGYVCVCVCNLYSYVLHKATRANSFTIIALLLRLSSLYGSFPS